MSNVLQIARRNQNLTQAQIASSLGCDQSTISNYERGAQQVSRELAPKYAELLKLDVLTVLYANSERAA